MALVLGAAASCARPQPLPLVTATAREIGQAIDSTESPHTRATDVAATLTATLNPNYLPGIYQNDGPPTATPTPTPTLSNETATLTPTQAPSATPTPPWPEPIDGPSASKLGVHAVGVASNNLKVFYCPQKMIILMIFNVLYLEFV